MRAWKEYMEWRMQQPTTGDSQDQEVYRKRQVANDALRFAAGAAAGAQRSSNPIEKWGHRRRLNKRMDIANAAAADANAAATRPIL